MTWQHCFVLDECGDPVQADFATFIRWSDSTPPEDSQVASDVVEQYRITSSFLGLNHASDDGIPLLFETWIVDQSDQQRSLHDWLIWAATHAGAMDNHQRAIALVRASLTHK